MVTKYSRRLAESRTGLEGRPKAPRQSGYGAVFSLGEASGNTPNPQHEYNRTTTYTMGRTRNAPRRFVNAILEVVQSEESCPFADPLWDVAIADFYVRGSATRGIATVAHVPTGFMLVLTKQLAKIKFFRFVNAILGIAQLEDSGHFADPHRKGEKERQMRHFRYCLVFKEADKEVAESQSWREGFVKV